MKNLSDTQLTTEQINLLSRGLKLIPTPVMKENQIRCQLISDFNQFARRMCLQYIYHDQNTEQHPFHVKSSWIPPIHRSVALETYLEEVKIKLPELHWLNLKIICHPARKLTNNKEIILKKEDKNWTFLLHEFFFFTFFFARIFFLGIFPCMNFFFSWSVPKFLRPFCSERRDREAWGEFTNLRENDPNKMAEERKENTNHELTYYQSLSTHSGPQRRKGQCVINRLYTRT